MSCYLKPFDKERSFDKARATVYAPKQKVQYAMIIGLTYNWKHLVYYNLDCNMIKDILFNIINKLEEATTYLYLQMHHT